MRSIALGILLVLSFAMPAVSAPATPKEPNWFFNPFVPAQPAAKPAVTKRAAHSRTIPAVESAATPQTVSAPQPKSKRVVRSRTSRTAVATQPAEFNLFAAWMNWSQHQQQPSTQAKSRTTRAAERNAAPLPLMQFHRADLSVEYPMDNARQYAEPFRRAGRANARPRMPSLFASSDLVSEARRWMGTNPTSMNRLWCARFMNFVLERSGYSGTGSDAARSFAKYGVRVDGPQIGAIAVLTRGRNGGHVGVVSGIDAAGNPIIISGNHGRKVGEGAYPRSRVLAYVRPI